MTAIFLTYLIGAIIVAVVMLVGIKQSGGPDGALDEFNEPLPSDEHIDASQVRNTVLFIVFLWPIAVFMVVLYVMNLNKGDR